MSAPTKEENRRLMADIIQSRKIESQGSKSDITKRVWDAFLTATTTVPMSESPDVPDSISTTAPSKSEDKVSQYAWQWQELNKATAWTSDELFNLCLYSESIIVKALKEFSSPQLHRFRSILQVLRGEVHDRAHHYLQACEFAESLSPNVCKFDLSPADRARAVENLRLPGCNQDLIDTDPAVARELLDPRSLIYRRTQQATLIQGANIAIATRLQSLLSRPTSPPQAYFDVTEFHGPSDDLLYGDGSSTHQAPFFIVHRSRSESESESSPSSSRNRSRSALESDIKQTIQEAHEDLVDIILVDLPTGATDSSSELKSMAITTEVTLPLPVLPQGWTAEKDFKAIGTVSKATQRSIEPVGPHFLAHARRARHKRTFSEDDRIQAQESVKKVEDDDAGEISEPEDPAMLMRDAKDWKGQDHYAVLGLSKYRWKATEEQIKRAHRKKVLRHHPDKKAAAGSTEDDSFFKCIQKATEILLDPVKRRQFDSVDEAADVEPPSKKQTQKGNFYKLWGPVFKSEGRFSRIQPVPKLGDENSTREDVENFYNFWYNFDSWRSFEYQDEDVPDDNENRDQKRHMERKNNNARKKKKTEDSARLRKLLDDCSALDDRIKKFRQEANASKNKKKIEKEAAEKKAAEETKAKKEQEEKAAKDAEEAAKTEREQGKKAKEAAKNAVKKNKRVLKNSVKDANYFVQGDPPAATIDAVLNDVELVQGKVDPDEIAALAAKLTGLKVADEIKTVWSDEVKRLIEGGKLTDGEISTMIV